MEKPIKEQVQEFLDGKRSFIDASGENDHVLYWDEFLERQDSVHVRKLVARELSVDDLLTPSKASL